MREITMTTISIHATSTTSATSARWRRLSALPWLTALPLAAVMAYADGFWMISLRGTVGAIERTQQPFATWLRESTLALPLFILAVLGALTLAARWFGPTPQHPKTIAATALLIVAATTLTAIALLTASSAYDYHLQSNQLQLMGSMPGMPAMALTPGIGTAEQQQATLALQARAVGYGSALLLATNLALVPWTIAIRGGRLDVRITRK